MQVQLEDGGEGPLAGGAGPAEQGWRQEGAGHRARAPRLAQRVLGRAQQHPRGDWRRGHGELAAEGP
eukprot:12380400-Alexandrium_andersonii.AAC.1